MDVLIAREIGSKCIGLHVRRTARRVTRLYDEALAPLDLTIGQFSTLAMLAARDDWSMQSLADAMGTDRSSLTAGLKPLERRGLIESRSDANDGRVRQLALTPLGLAALDDAEPLWRTAQARLEDILGSNRAEALRSASNRLSKD